ncbi:MAG: hypothetical protein KDF54_06650, partial [Hydrogenophaga sp.]|nr:hypothetical protein [Hydrogenophaga sp.]
VWVLLRHPRLPATALVGIAALVGLCTGSYMSLALMLPALVFLPQRRQFVWVGAGLLLGFVLFKAVGLFYKVHPDHIVHLFPRLAFKVGYLVHNFGIPEIHEALFHLVGLTAAVCVLAMVPGARRWEWLSAGRWVIGLGGVGLALLLMVANNKVVEFNSGTPFFSVYRMMLPLPFLGLLLLGLPGRPSRSVTPTEWSRTGRSLAAAALVTGLLAVQLVRLVQAGPVMADLPSTVPPVTFEWLRANCEEIGGWWKASGEPYFVLEERNDSLAYGCHAQYQVPVLQTEHERRTWLKGRFDQGVPR